MELCSMEFQPKGDILHPVNIVQKKKNFKKSPKNLIDD